MAQRLLSVGMIGDDVATLHETLLQHGLKIPESETGRGFFGPATRTAVLAIQDRNRLAVTGQVDTTTAAALLMKPADTARPVVDPFALLPSTAGRNLPRPITPPLPHRDRGADVANLQDALLLLLEKQRIRLPDDERRELEERLHRERERQVYGTGTGNVVIAFRQQFQLEPGEIVDERTAEALNGLLQEIGAFDTPQAEWVVRGQVVDASGPINGIQVSVFDRDLFFRRGGANSGQHLGTEVTRRLPTKNEDGCFELVFATADFAAGDEPVEGVTTPDLIFALSKDRQPLEKFQIYRLPDGKEVVEESLVSDDDLIMGIQARRVEEVRIVIVGDEKKREPPEYERLWRAIEPLLPEQASADAEDASREATVCAAAERFDEETHRDISFIAREIDWDFDPIFSFSRACRLAREFGHRVSSAVLYGLARTAGLRDTRALGSTSLVTLTEALRRAVADNVIGPMDEPEITAAVELIRRVAPAHALDQPLNGSTATLGGVLALAIASTEQQVELLQLAAEHQRAPAEFWQKLREHPTFAAKAGEIQYVTRLSALTRHNLPLIEKLRRELPEATSLRHLAFALDEARLKEMVRVGGVTLPEGLPGENEDEQRDLYAETMVNLMRAAEPMAASARAVKRLSTEEGAPVSPGAAAFMEKLAIATDFDLLRSRVDDFAHLLEGGDEASNKLGVEQVKRALRLTRISTGEANFNGLLRSGLNSASDINRRYTRSGFLAEHQETLGGEAQANLVYSRSLAISNAALMMAIQTHQLANDVQPYVVTGGLKETPSWAGMFRSVEMCDCEHCRSWYKPSGLFRGPAPFPRT